MASTSTPAPAENPIGTIIAALSSVAPNVFSADAAAIVAYVIAIGGFHVATGQVAAITGILVLAFVAFQGLAKALTANAAAHP